MLKFQIEWATLVVGLLVHVVVCYQPGYTTKITSGMLRIVGKRECARKIISTYDITVCTVPDTYIYIYIEREKIARSHH